MAKDRECALQMNDFEGVTNKEAKKRQTTGDENENATLIGQRNSPETTARLRTSALLISWLSIFFSLGTGIAAIILSVTGRSEALFAYGLDAILDSFSSVAVVWRFHVAVECVYSVERERKACIAIGALFFVSAASLIVKSVHAIVVETHESKQITLYASFALSCGIISVIIAAVKIYVGMKIGSQALYTDSIITLVGAATCFAGVAGLELYVEDTHLWFLDSVFGIVCGLFLLVFGIR
ncbi:hypothetical protein BsWGS_26542 [Bradybaena similaris]